MAPSPTITVMMQVDEALTPATTVYRYLPFECFVEFVETECTVLTNINL